MRQSTSNGLIALLLTLGFAGCVIDARDGGVVTRDEKRLTVSGPPQLNLRTFDGNITVRSWDEKDVRVEIVRRGPDAQAAAALVVNVTQDGNKILVDAPSSRKRDGGIHIGFWNSGSVSLIITTPRNVSIEARTGDGAITVTSIDGTIKAHSGDGSIRIDDAVGSVDADTGDGAIDLSGRLDGVSLRSGDGSIKVRVDAGSTLAGDWTITTGDGSIDLRLPDTLNADVDAHTGDGRVRAEGLSNVTTDDRRDRQTVRGRLGTGGRTLRVRSGDGSIIIAR